MLNWLKLSKTCSEIIIAYFYFYQVTFLIYVPFVTHILIYISEKKSRVNILLDPVLLIIVILIFIKSSPVLPLSSMRKVIPIMFGVGTGAIECHLSFAQGE